MRGIVVGKFLVDFQPGGQLPGGGALLVHRHWMAVRNRTISGRRDGVHVGYTGTDLGAAAFDLSHRSSRGAALGHAENRIRPPRSGVAGSDCGGAFCRSSRACLLADPSSLELDVSGGKRCEMK